LEVNVGHFIVTNGILCVRDGNAAVPKLLWHFLLLSCPTNTDTTNVDNKHWILSYYKPQHFMNNCGVKVRTENKAHALKSQCSCSSFSARQKLSQRKTQGSPRQQTSLPVVHNLRWEACLVVFIIVQQNSDETSAELCLSYSIAPYGH